MTRPADSSGSTVTRVEKRRTISPYYLSSSDIPGASISHPLLDGRNYDEWSRSFKTALESRKKFGFLDGTISKPAADSPDFEDWTPINALLVSWIKMSVNPEIRTNLSHRPLARDLWEHIKKRYDVSNGPKNQQIKADLANCKQGNFSVESYYGKLTKIWDSMASYRPLRVCKCGGCSCDLATQQERDREEDKVQQFLYGLDDSHFGSVRSTLTLRVPLPSLEETYNFVRQEEDLQRNSNTRENQGEVTAFAAHTRPRYDDSRNKGKSDDDKSALCKHCNRSGHSSDNCFAVFGYPEWWGDRPRSKSVFTRGRGRGNYSGGTSRAGSHGTSRANAVSTHATSSVDHANHIITDRDRDAVVGLTDEQWRTVTALVNSRTTTNPPNHSENLTGPQYEDGDWSW